MQQGALPEVAQDQRREHGDEPHQADRCSAEVAEVSVERLGAGHGEHDGAQDQEACRAVAGQEAHAVPRIDGRQNLRRLGDLHHAEHRDRREPHEHDRSEDGSDAGRAPALKHEEREENEERGGHDVRLEPRAGDLQALGRAQDRDGRRDDTVTVEQRGAEEPEEHHEGAWRLATRTPCALDQREKREDAALASIVEPHDEGDVLHADDEDQRPHDQREDAVHGGGRGGDPMVGVKALAERVEWTRADVTEDDTERGQRQRGEPATRAPGRRPRERSPSRRQGAGDELGIGQRAGW
jgi:hypothetical protein